MDATSADIFSQSEQERRQLVELENSKEYTESTSLKRLELKRLWNGALLVHKLPNELLIRIFADFRQAASSPVRPESRSSSRSLSREGTPGPITDWHSLMLVCHKWRDLLVSTPMFWRTVDMKGHVEWTKLCLDRSAAASLDVRADDGDRCPLDMLYLHAHRFQRLSTSLSISEAGPLLSGGMPLLEDLELRDVTPLELMQCIDSALYLTSHRFPRLQTLALVEVFSPRDPSLYAQLRTLSLSDCAHHFSFHGFLDILAGCARLEELTLTQTLDGLGVSDEWPSRKPIPHRPPVVLPHLRSFSLEQRGIVRTSQFLAHLLIPASAHLKVAGDFLRRDDSPDSDTADTLGALLPPNRATVLPVLSTTLRLSAIVAENPRSIDVASSESILPPRGAGEHEKHRVDAQFALHLDGNDPGQEPWMAQCLRDLVECFGASPLTHLDLLWDHSSSDAADWERVFRTFPLLEELIVGSAQYYEAAKVFVGLHAASSEARVDSLVIACPNLRQVSLGGVDAVATYEAMRECLQDRADRGARLQVLDLSMVFNKDLTSETNQTICGFVEDLRQAVQCVRVEDN
ncbi:hypothetical protein GSI_03439 [Ganoderma sinense ZZ0214-1]|uniref:Uncharacterized protein n=1 Tax=Ganoderma sinense ZZ0214-1 TaxID=1077348 RepID=A0A2G8SLN0_9APHY|nr:hypothetical protein GSI_03439 [Ganoderma sinense ZZ0214-1]